MLSKTACEGLLFFISGIQYGIRDGRDGGICTFGITILEYTEYSYSYSYPYEIGIEKRVLDELRRNGKREKSSLFALPFLVRQGGLRE